MRKILLLLPFVLFACKGKQNVDNDVIASVDEKVLRRTEVSIRIPRGISSADSLIMAESIVKKWVKDILVYDVALRNLDDEKAEIDKLVEDYRNSLIRYRYQERLLKERLSGNIQESEKLRFYEENQQKFILDKALVKGLFLKIPIDAPGLSDIKTDYKQVNEEALEKIEKFSVQNATVYDYFYDRWVEFDQIIDNMPIRVADANLFLKVNKHVEEADSSYCYLLNISEYLPAGSVAPYDYANAQIIEMLINQRKVDFIRQFEDELYTDAIRQGKAKIIKEP
ncbi:peptidyl-prolyl cis-trans isomerase [Parabacteroides sp. OttesenSCG-928-G06]|nr:peptidyl-prolyl cis-trans isomerase [Parabacteroides sp. OttesenSCG-928-K15]MDL2282538.1 peptidyl-prolyl cis-trans isomerase [Parabacteroides sp. OttesenSCG-928-G06]